VRTASDVNKGSRSWRNASTQGLVPAVGPVQERQNRAGIDQGITAHSAFADAPGSPAGHSPHGGGCRRRRPPGIAMPLGGLRCSSSPSTCAALCRSQSRTAIVSTAESDVLRRRASRSRSDLSSLDTRQL
jgi:hypothetical protein